jgi:hypothetical protein
MEKLLSHASRGSVVLALATAIVVATAGGAYSAETLTVPSLTPLSEETVEAINRRPGIPGARNGFIERFGDNRVVVISDATKRFAPDARFYRGANGTPIYLNEIQVGTWVGYTVNDQAEIDVMWIAE